MRQIGTLVKDFQLGGTTYGVQESENPWISVTCLVQRNNVCSFPAQIVFVFLLRIC